MLFAQIWLFGYELADCIMVFAENEVHFLASKKKIDFLQQISVVKSEEGMPTFKFHPRDKVWTNLFCSKNLVHFPVLV
jgi:nucleosome binding factor SPN SPT16 subunit